MDISPFSKILPSLIEKSSKGEVNWSPVNNKSNSDFVVNFNRFAIRIKTVWDSDTNEPYVSLSILNEEGKQIENVTFDAENKDVSRLFEYARRKALNVDYAIEEITTELNKVGIVGTAMIKDEDFPF